MKSLLFRDVTVIDGSGREPQANMDVLVKDGRINALQAHGSLSYDEQRTEMYQLRGVTLLPGLIDCHVHIMMDGGPQGRVRQEESLGFCLLRAAYHARCTFCSQRIIAACAWRWKLACLSPWEPTRACHLSSTATTP